jgi:RimJ/RimL family protein N-acetyltransferase
MYSLDLGDPEETAACFLDPEHGYWAITDRAGEFVAYCCFGPDGRVSGGDYESPALDVGIGTRPDLAGRGGGQALTRAVLAFGRERYAPAAFRVTVAQFNERALRVVRAAGFEPVQTFERHPDGMVFVVLVRHERTAPAKECVSGRS